MQTTPWIKKSGMFGTRYILAPNPERVEIPAQFKSGLRTLVEKLFNVNVMICRFQNGKWDMVYNWPSRRLSQKA